MCILRGESLHFVRTKCTNTQECTQRAPTNGGKAIGPAQPVASAPVYANAVDSDGIQWSERVHGVVQVEHPGLCWVSHSCLLTNVHSGIFVISSTLDVFRSNRSYEDSVHHTLTWIAAWWILMIDLCTRQISGMMSMVWQFRCLTCTLVEVVLQSFQQVAADIFVDWICGDSDTRNLSEGECGMQSICIA